MSDTLPFTGERFTPECEREIAYEHWHRYAFARSLARGRRVLDAACGEGYGSAMLARAGAASVLGLDLDAASVGHATRRYADVPGLRFDTADATRLDHLPDACFDLVVSFETLEHVHEQARLLDGFARVLAPGGLLLVSTPDKANYNPPGSEPNPFHVRELERGEFEGLLAARFPARRLYGQKLAVQSLMWSLDCVDGPAETLALDGGAVVSGPALAPTYYVAACALDHASLAGLPALSLFGDAAESVYADYRDEVRRNRAAAAHIAHLEAELARLRNGT